MASARDNSAGKKIWMIGGVIAVVGVVGYLGLNYPPATDDAA